MPNGENKSVGVVVICLLFFVCVACFGCAEKTPEAAPEQPDARAWTTGQEQVDPAIRGLVYPGDSTQVGYDFSAKSGNGEKTYSVTLYVPEQMEDVSTYYAELLAESPGFHRTQRLGPGKQRADVFNAMWNGFAVNLQVTPDTANEDHTLVVITAALPEPSP